MTDRLALGTAQFGLPYGIANRAGQVPQDEAAAILRYARANGSDTLDTAMAYGESEERLGNIGVGQWQVISKLGPMPDSCADVFGWVGEAVRGSLARLRLSQLRGLLLHRPQQLLGTRGSSLYDALRGLKEEGTVGLIGISIYGPDELEALVSRFRFDLVQAPFNILDRRLVTSGWLTRLAEAGVAVHTRSVFLQGLLLMNGTTRPVKFSRWASLWDAWDRWLTDGGMAPLRACMAYALSQQGIERVVVGTDNLAQAEEIFSTAGAGLPLPPPANLASEDLDLIDPSRWNLL